MEAGKTKYTLTFSVIKETQVNFTVQDQLTRIEARYNKSRGEFYFDTHNELSKELVQNQLQLKKIIHSALKGKGGSHQPVNFAFIKDFPFLRNHDYENYIQVDRRNKSLDIQVKKLESVNIHKLYTDGSYSSDEARSAYAGVIIEPGNYRYTFHSSSQVKSSNLIELLAITEGLKQLQHVEKIQVNTDSRFVIRGLAQWIHFWKLNDWHTAYGSRVKFARHWKELDRFSDGKLIELKWIKARSGNPEHNRCHQIAKQIATAKYNT